MSEKVTGLLMQGQDNKLSAKELVIKYIIYLPLFVICIGLSYAVAYLYVRYKTPIYESSIQVLIKNDDKNGVRQGEIDLEDFGLVDKKANLANEIEILKSVSLMSHVIENAHLNVEYFNQGSIRTSEMFYPAIPFVMSVGTVVDSSKEYSFTIVKQNNDFRIESAKTHKIYKLEQKIEEEGITATIHLYDTSKFIQDYKYIIRWRNSRDIAADIMKELDVKQMNKDASILRVELKTPIPAKGEAILNQFVKDYNKASLDDKNLIVENTLQFINTRLPILSTELKDVEDTIQNFRQANNIVDAAAQSEMQYSGITTLKNKIEEAELKMNILDMLRDYVSDPQKRDKLVPSSLGIEDITLIELVKGYNELLLRRTQSLKTVPEANPTIQVMNSQLETVRRNILENLNNIRSVMARNVSSLNAEYNQTLGKMRQIPKQERELMTIMRKQGIKEKLFLFLFQKREESEITRASAIGAAKAIDPASTPTLPASPDRNGIYRIAIITGLLLGFVLIYLRDLLNDKITVRQDIQKVTQMPILGELFHHQAKERKLIVTARDRSLLSEQFRIIRTNLQFLNKNAKSPVILVTSSIPGEGKTFCSMNLASVWAVAGKKTVILELDLRKPKIASSLGIDNSKGITTYVLGESKIEDITAPIPGHDNLFIISSGPVPPNPSEILMDQKMDDLISHLRQTFDFIIMDTAPIGLVSDAKILSRFADSTLYIIRQRYTLKKQLYFIEDLYQHKVFSNIGLLVNDVKTGGVNSYYGYGYGTTYGYGYGYTSYENANVKTSFFQRLRQFFGINN